MPRTKKTAAGPPKTRKEKTAPRPAGDYRPRLREQYRTGAVPRLMEKFSYRNRHQVPMLEKVVLNIGMGKAVQNAKLLDNAVRELGVITGQRPVVTNAKKSIAGFKIRAGMPIGCRVTLRGSRMYEFLDRLCSIALPRIRDFKGISPKCFDGRGNYSLGVREQLIFPEIKFDEVAEPHGMDITIVTSAKTNDEARELLQQLGLPFRAA